MLTKEERRQICWENAQKSRKYNEFIVRDGVAYVQLSNTHNIMLCDADDWESWKQYCWHENTDNHYAVTSINGKQEKYHYHLLPPDGDLVLDHINRNKLDNRLCNVRRVSRHANSVNTKLSRANKSGIKGVRQTPSGKWQAYIWANGKSKHLGVYDRKSDAIEARRQAEQMYFLPLFC